MLDHPAVTLFHQAAHAVAAVSFETPVPRLDVARTDCKDLFVPARPTGQPNSQTQSALMAPALVFLIGPMADSLSSNHYLDAAEDNREDVARSREIVGWILSNGSRLRDVMRGELTINASDFLANWEHPIAEVAALARRQGVVTADQTRDLVQPAIDDYRRLSAYHEAAHAVGLWLEGNGELPPGIVVGKSPNEASQNLTFLRKFSQQFHRLPTISDPKDRELAFRELEHIVAGEEMAKLVDPKYPGPVRARNDRQEAQRLARKLAYGAGKSAETIEADARSAVRQRFESADARALVDALATTLLAQGSLRETAIRRVLQDQKEQ